MARQSRGASRSWDAPAPSPDPPPENMFIRIEDEDDQFNVYVDSDDNCGGTVWHLQYSPDGVIYDDDLDFSTVLSSCEFPVLAFEMGDSPVAGWYRVRNETGGTTLGVSNGIAIGIG